jgi:hypothetical protein
MYDPASGKITHIDFSHEFGSGSRVPSFSPSQVALTDLRARDAATVGLSKADLRSFTDRTSQIEGIARKIGLAPDDINGLRARLGVLSKVAAMPQPTLADLWHEGDVLYNTTRA